MHGIELQALKTVVRLIPVVGLGRRRVPCGSDRLLRPAGGGVALGAGLLELVLGVLLLVVLVLGHRLTGLALGPFHRVGEILQRSGSLLAGVCGLDPLGGLQAHLLPEGVDGLALQRALVQPLETLGDVVERRLEVRQMLGRRTDLAGAAVDQLLGVLGLVQLELGRLGAHRVGGRAGLVPHPVAAALPADVVQPVTGPVARALDEIPRAFDEVLGLVLDAVRYEIPPAHQFPPPLFRCAVEAARSSGDGP